MSLCQILVGLLNKLFQKAKPTVSITKIIIQKYILSISFIFYNYEKHGGDANELNHIFEILDKNKVLIFALFVAHRASTDFSSMLYEYLYNNIDSYIDCPQTCYSVLYFVFNSVLKM